MLVARVKFGQGLAQKNVVVAGLEENDLALGVEKNLKRNSGAGCIGDFLMAPSTS
jgi:hypothetical protein